MRESRKPLFMEGRTILGVERLQLPHCLTVPLLAYISDVSVPNFPATEQWLGFTILRSACTLCPALACCLMPAHRVYGRLFREAQWQRLTPWFCLFCPSRLTLPYSRTAWPMFDILWMEELRGPTSGTRIVILLWAE